MSNYLSYLKQFLFLILLLVCFYYFNSYNSIKNKYDSLNKEYNKLVEDYETYKESVRNSNNIQKEFTKSIENIYNDSADIIYGGMCRKKDLSTKTNTSNSVRKTRGLDPSYRQDFYRLRTKYNRQRLQLERLINLCGDKNES